MWFDCLPFQFSIPFHWHVQVPHHHGINSRDLRSLLTPFINRIAAFCPGPVHHHSRRLRPLSIVSSPSSTLPSLRIYSSQSFIVTCSPVLHNYEVDPQHKPPQNETQASNRCMLSIGDHETRSAISHGSNKRILQTPSAPEEMTSVTTYKIKP